MRLHGVLRECESVGILGVTIAPTSDLDKKK